MIFQDQNSHFHINMIYAQFTPLELKVTLFGLLNSLTLIITGNSVICPWMTVPYFNDFSRLFHFNKLKYFFLMKFDDFSKIMKRISISVILHELWEPCMNARIRLAANHTLAHHSRWWFSSIGENKLNRIFHFCSHLVQYIPRNMHTVFVLLCFVVVIHWLIFPYPSGLLHWHCGNLTIAPVPAKQPWWIWINTSCEFIMNNCITTTKQSTTKPCAYFLGYTVPTKSLFKYPGPGHCH